jgi:hypothetical protein
VLPYADILARARGLLTCAAIVGTIAAQPSFAATATGIAHSHRTYEWDAAHRLIAINQFDPPGSTTPAKRSEFGYNERSERGIDFR